MKLVSFTAAGKASWGVLDDRGIAAIGMAAGAPASLKVALQQETHEAATKGHSTACCQRGNLGW